MSIIFYQGDEVPGLARKIYVQSGSWIFFFQSSEFFKSKSDFLIFMGILTNFNKI